MSSIGPSRSKINLYIWGSSHATELHYLPQSFEELGVDSRFSDPVWNARSGGIINQSTINEIMRVMTRDSRRLEKQVHVLFLGSNNLRNENTDWTPQEVHDFFEMVVIHARGLFNVHIVICGILPSPEKNDQSIDRFKPASSLLKDLSTRYRPLTSYINIPDFFNAFGEIKWYLYNGGQIHLTKLGAEKLAEIFKNHLNFHPEKDF